MTSETERLQRLTELWTTKPESFESLLAQLLDAKHLVQIQTANMLEQPLNEYLKSMPIETVVQRREVAERIGNILDALDIAIKSPVSGVASRLQVSLSPGKASGTFSFLETPADRNHKRYLCRREVLPHLELVPRPRSTEKASWLARLLEKSAKQDLLNR